MVVILGIFWLLSLGIGLGVLNPVFQLRGGWGHAHKVIESMVFTHGK